MSISINYRDPAPLPRLRVLVSAFASNPHHGSEPGVGWHIPVHLARYHDITLLLNPGPADRDRNAITHYLREHGPIPGLTFHFIERPPLSRLLQHDSLALTRPLHYIGYAAWQRAAYREARRLHHDHPFDLVHHLNIVGYREPGYLWKLPLPFVWGPIAGASNLPWPHLPLLGGKERLVYGARTVLNQWKMRTARRCRRAARAARLIWAVGHDEQHMLERWGVDCNLLVETGGSVRPIPPRDYDATRPLQLVWSGLHIGRKALPILLHALAAASMPVQLTVLGAGRETARWKALAAQLGLEPHIRWLGQLPYEQAQQAMAHADALAFPSLLEGTPHVVLEALSIGLPVLCHDACGMGIAVTDDCGIKIPMHTPQQSIDGFANAIRQLFQPGQVRRLSEGALRRAAELSWESKARQIALAYWQVIAADRRDAPAITPAARGDAA